MSDETDREQDPPEHLLRCRDGGKLACDHHRDVRTRHDPGGQPVLPAGERGTRHQVPGVRAGGNVQIEDGRDLVTLNRNRVDGDVQLFANLRGIAVNDNQIAGNLQCKENRGPITGTGNRVDGNKEDQCRQM